MSYEPFVEAALNACDEVVRFLNTSDPQTLYQSYDVGAGGDVSFGFDIEAEKIFFNRLGAFGTLDSEEGGIMGDTASEYTIVLDPVDGSDNFKSSIPYYGTSIALLHGSKPVAGIICNFCTGECFVRVGDERYVTNLSGVNVRTAIETNPHAKAGLFEKAYAHPKLVEKLGEAGLKFRSPGAVALSLGYAYYVDYVLFLGTMRPYDLVAGLFWCEELHCYQDEEVLVISKDKTMFERLLKLLQRSSSEHS
jgi:myo-inositol-1(or 4)-monophosphatase